MHAGQVLARDAEASVDLRPAGEDDRVVVRAELVDRNVGADLNVAEEAHTGGLVEDLGERGCYRLDPGWSGATP